MNEVVTNQESLLVVLPENRLERAISKSMWNGLMKKLVVPEMTKSEDCYFYFGVVIFLEIAFH
jgi:hypothetical protein